MRRLLLVGRLDEAERTLAGARPRAVPAGVAGGARVGGRGHRDAPAAHQDGARARWPGPESAAQQAGIPALTAEVASAQRLLETPAARLLARGEERPLRLEEVEALQASPALVVDACRHVVRQGSTTVSLAGRPVLFALARALAEAWPNDAARGALLARAFGARHADESHRARLRVEIGRLRAKLRPLARISATAQGFALGPRRDREVVVLARPVEEPHGEVLALLADGEAWSSSALALALGASQRTVQRALDALAVAGKVQSFGRGRARRWLTPPLPGFTTTLLLPRRCRVARSIAGALSSERSEVSWRLRPIAR